MLVKNASLNESESYKLQFFLLYWTNSQAFLVQNLKHEMRVLTAKFSFNFVTNEKREMSVWFVILINVSA